ncbi:MAG TPA: hypothetical protein VK524_05410 [Polyangiaceae bacterium]|nr:hypothetical protein [Polyangiaceae bacterium]
MRSWVSGVWLCALLAGACSAESGDAPAAEEAEQTSSTSDELRISTGVADNTCPGGGSPACVVCNNGCKWACAGDYSCQTGGGICAFTHGVCKTVSFAPIGGGFATYIR